MCPVKPPKLPEIELFRLAQTDLGLREAFLIKKQRLVRNICFKYCGMLDDDMMQEGNIGLMIAFEKFDPDLGFQFDTYAKQWVFSYIQQYNWKKHTVRIGKRLRNKRLQEGGETRITTISLDWRTDEGDYHYEVEDTSAPVDELIQKQHDIHFVQQFVSQIKSERNREMLKAYYGLEDSEPINMTVLSDIYKVSKQRCQQIISAEVKKIGEAYSHLDFH